MSNAATDLGFLAELITQTDANGHSTGVNVGATIGITDTEQLDGIVQRLRNRGLIEQTGGTPRLGDGFSDFTIRPTVEGYKAVTPSEPA